MSRDRSNQEIKMSKLSNLMTRLRKENVSMDEAETSSAELDTIYSAVENLKDVNEVCDFLSKLLDSQKSSYQFICLSLMTWLGTNSLLHYAGKVYEMLITREYTNQRIHESMIYLAGYNNQFKIAQHAFKNACAEGIQNSHLYKVMIHAINKCLTPDKDVEELLNSAFVHGCITSEVLFEVVAFAQKNLKAKFLDQAFDMAVRINLTDLSFYLKLIYVAGELKEVNIATKVYDHALQYKTADVYTVYRKMIQAAGISNRLDIAQKVYETAINSGYDHFCIEAAMIEAASENNQMDLAIAIYEKTKRLSIQNPRIYKAIINSAIIHGRADVAEQVYHDGIEAYLQLKEYDPKKTGERMGGWRFFIVSSINAGKKFNNLFHATEAYKKALKLGIDSNEIHISMANMLLSYREYCVAQSNADKTSKDYSTTLLQELRMRSYLNEAYTAYQESKMKLSFKKTSYKKSRYAVDTHRTPFACVYFGLKDFIANTEKPFNLMIIHGKGKHNRRITADEIIPSKKTILVLMDDLRSDYDITFTPNPDNEGCAMVEVKEKPHPTLLKSTTITHQTTHPPSNPWKDISSTNNDNSSNVTDRNNEKELTSESTGIKPIEKNLTIQTERKPVANVETNTIAASASSVVTSGNKSSVEAVPNVTQKNLPRPSPWKTLVNVVHTENSLENSSTKPAITSAGINHGAQVKPTDTKPVENTIALSSNQASILFKATSQINTAPDTKPVIVGRKPMSASSAAFEPSSAGFKPKKIG